MEGTLNIQNLKCGGCANTITNRLEELEGVSNVKVDNETHSVTFKYSEIKAYEKVKMLLSTLGYPVEGESNPVTKKAKSYVSCAVGRFNT